MDFEKSSSSLQPVLETNLLPKVIAAKNFCNELIKESFDEEETRSLVIAL